MSPLLAAVGAVLGAAYGWYVCRALAGRGYRYEDELDWPRRDHRPVVVVGTALLAAVLVGGAPRAGLYTVLPLAVLAVGVPLSVVDLDVRRLPNKWLLPAIPAALGLALVLAAVTGEWGRLLQVAWMTPAALAAFFVLFLLGGGSGFGFGDVKLSALLAVPLAWLGGWTVVVGFVVPFLLGGVVAMALILLRLATRKTPIPFGPFMVAGTLLVAGLPGLAR